MGTEYWWNDTDRGSLKYLGGKKNQPYTITQLNHGSSSLNSKVTLDPCFKALSSTKLPSEHAP